MDEVYQIFSRWSPEELNRVIQLTDGDISRAIDSVIEHERTGIPLEVILGSRSTPHQASQRSQQQQSLAPTSSNQPTTPGMSTRGSRSVGPSFRSDMAMHNMHPPTAQLQEANIHNLVDGRTHEEYNQTFASSVATRPPSTIVSTTFATHNNNNNNTTAPPPSRLINEDTTAGYPTITMPTNEQHHASTSPQVPMQSLNSAAAVPSVIQVPEHYNSVAGGAGGEMRRPPYPMQGEVFICAYHVSIFFLVVQFTYDTLLFYPSTATRHSNKYREYNTPAQSPEELLLQRLSREEKDALLHELLYARQEKASSTIRKMRRREMDMLNTQMGILVSFNDENEARKKPPSPDLDEEAMHFGMRQSREDWQEYCRKLDQANAMEEALLEEIKAKSLKYDSSNCANTPEEEQVLEDVKRESLALTTRDDYALEEARRESLTTRHDSISEEETSQIEQAKRASLDPPSSLRIEENLIEEAKRESLSYSTGQEQRLLDEVRYDSLVSQSSSNGVPGRQVTEETVECSDLSVVSDRKMPAKEL